MAIHEGFKLWRPSDEDSFIIAYGSNLSEKRMKERCPGASVYGTSVIHGYRMLFKQSCTGAYATIEQDANSQIPVVIYRVTAEDETRLDRFEGCPRYYRKQEFLLPVWAANRKKRRNRVSCIAYVMHEYRILGEPSAAYFSLLDQGYDRLGFDHEILFRAMEDSIGREAAGRWLDRFYDEKTTGEKRDEKEKVLHSLRIQPFRGADGGQVPGREDRGDGGAEGLEAVLQAARDHRALQGRDGAGAGLGDQ